MATTKTLAQLRTLAREKADMSSGSFITDSELNGYLNSSGSELYDLLVQTNADYYISSNSFTISSGNTQALPSDFYKLRGLDYVLDNNNAINIGKFNFRDRNKKRSTIWRSIAGTAPYREYRVLGSNLHIEPSENASGNYKLWYIPAFTEMSSDSDTLDSINHWYEYVVVDAAIKMLMKEESDVSTLMFQKQALAKRIREMSAERDHGEPETVVDVSDTYDWELI